MVTNTHLGHRKHSKPLLQTLTSLMVFLKNTATTGIFLMVGNGMVVYNVSDEDDLVYLILSESVVDKIMCSLDGKGFMDVRNNTNNRIFDLIVAWSSIGG